MSARKIEIVKEGNSTIVKIKQGGVIVSNTLVYYKQTNLSIKANLLHVKSDDNPNLFILHEELEDNLGTTNLEDYIVQASALFFFSIESDGSGSVTSQSLVPYCKLTDVNGDVFTSAATAKAYLADFTDTSVFTNEIYNADSGIYQFTCPEGSDFSGSDGFCGGSGTKLQFEDKWNLVTKFGNTAFEGNAKDNEFGTYWNQEGIPITTTFGDNCFDGSYGSNKLYGKYIFGDSAFVSADVSQFRKENYINFLFECGSNFCNNFIGVITINRWGTTSGADLPSDIFTSNGLILLKTPYSNKFINSENPDGDILIAIGNITNANSVISYDGVDDSSLKLNKTTATTGSVISFVTPQIYNTNTSPSASNITNNLTGAVIGVVQKIYSNKAVEPTYPAGWVKIGFETYTPGALNIIFAEWISGTRVEYWIVKPAS